MIRRTVSRPAVRRSSRKIIRDKPKTGCPTCKGANFIHRFGLWMPCRTCQVLRKK